MNTHLHTAYSFVTGLLLSASVATAQQLDSLSMGAGYTNDVYLNLESGQQWTVPATTWDIAFEIPGISSGILVNEGKGNSLYYIPESTPETYNETLDISNIANWEQLNNSAEQWSLGAFNRGFDYNTGNFGWGEYNMVTHRIAGTSVYVLILPNNTGAKKIFIESLSGGRFNFKYADLDGSNEQFVTLNKADFKGKNFAYYSLTTNEQLDREPASAEWDVLFGKYMDVVSDNTGNKVPYGVTGVRTNHEIGVAKVAEGAVNNILPSPLDYQYEINAIGWDWKAFSFESGWRTDTTTAYFVRTSSTQIRKLVFKRFGGASNGNVYFTVSPVNTTSVESEKGQNLITAGVYPSVIAHGELAVLLLSGATADAQTTVTIVNSMGQQLFRQEYNVGSNMIQLPLPSTLTSGAYMALIECGNSRKTVKFIVQ